METENNLTVINNIFVSRHFSLKNWVGRSVVKIGGKVLKKCFFFIFLLTR